jgi:hypothetical protein
MDESRANILGKGIGFSHALFPRKLNVAPKGAGAQMRPNPWQLRRTGAQFHLPSSQRARLKPMSHPITMNGPFGGHNGLLRTMSLDYSPRGCVKSTAAPSVLTTLVVAIVFGTCSAFSQSAPSSENNVKSLLLGKNEGELRAGRLTCAPRSGARSACRWTRIYSSNTCISLKNIGSEPVSLSFIFSAPGFEDPMRCDSVPAVKPPPRLRQSSRETVHT